MSDRPRTFTEQARRRQIIDGTIALVAERGYAGTSLSGIAARCGISKASVLYHFASKDEVVRATFADVVDAFVADVGAAVDAADGPEAMLLAYLHGSLAHLRAHPARMRVMVEGLVAEPAPGSPAAASRWQAVAGMLADGQALGVFRPFDPRALAVIVSGALDAVAAEWLGDPTFDLDAAAAELEGAVLRMLRP